MPEIKELKYKRDRFGGGDGRAINKHSIRVYEYAGAFFELDRTLDACPPCFTLYRIPDAPGLCPIVPVGGREYWGDGLSWLKAERLAFESIASA